MARIRAIILLAGLSFSCGESTETTPDDRQMILSFVGGDGVPFMELSRSSGRGMTVSPIWEIAQFDAGSSAADEPSADSVPAGRFDGRLVQISELSGKVVNTALRGSLVGTTGFSGSAISNVGFTGRSSTGTDASCDLSRFCDYVEVACELDSDASPSECLEEVEECRVELIEVLAIESTEFVCELAELAECLLSDVSQLNNQSIFDSDCLRRQGPIFDAF